MFAAAGGVLAALAGHAVFPGGAAGLQLALAPGGKPAGLMMMLAAVTLTALLLALLAQGARIAATAAATPLIARTAALREKSWRAGYLPQLDPDAPGRSRPRAPSVSPAAA